MTEQKISVLMPLYNGGLVVGETLTSLFRQGYHNFEIIISDDCSTDNGRQVIESFNDRRIKSFRNKKNLGYGSNLERCRQLASADADIIFLMAQDDLLAAGTFHKVNQAFQNYPEIGAVLRPFFLFADDIKTPIRDFPPYDREKDTILSLADGEAALRAIFGTVVQLSGLAFRRKFVEVPFHSDTMPAHTYPFFQILKNHPIMFLKDYTVAVRRYTSQTRHVSHIYEVSPTQSWIDMVNTIFSKADHKQIRQLCLRLVAQNFVGLVQLKNFSTLRILVREYCIMVRNYWRNLLSPTFWFFMLGTLLMPRVLLLPLVDWYQERVAARLLASRQITFSPAVSIPNQ